MNNTSHRRLGVVGAKRLPQKPISEDMAPFDNWSGPFIRTTLDDIPLSPKAPSRAQQRKPMPEAPPRRGKRNRDRRSFDKKNHNFKYQTLQKIIDKQDLGDIALQHTGLQLKSPLDDRVPVKFRRTQKPGRHKRSYGQVNLTPTVKEDGVADLPVNRSGNIAIYDKLLGTIVRRKLKRRDVSEDITNTFHIEVQQPMAGSQWRRIETLPAPDYQILISRMNTIKQGLPPGYRVRGVDHRGSLVDILF